MDGASLPNLEPSPRTIGPELTVRLLFGGFFSQFGWLFVAFGMLFVWLFDGLGGVVEAVRFGNEPPTTIGEVTSWRSTSFQINGRNVLETSYTYRLPGGDFAEGRSFSPDSYGAAGEAVVVEYVDRDPARSRIQGYRTTPGGLGVVFVFLFPAIGLIFAAIGFRRGWRAYRLLSIGELARGSLVSKEATSTRVNNQPVMKLIFAFDAKGGGSFEAVGKSHSPDRMEDEAAELVIYDPSEPSRAAVLDEFGCQPRVDGQGAFEASRPGLPTALFLLLPGLSVLTLLRYLMSLL